MPLIDCQLIVHSLESRHCCDVHSQLGTIRERAGGRRALHSDLVGEITLTRPRMGFHSGMRSSCEYASKHASADRPMATLLAHLSVMTALGARARVASEVVAARMQQLGASCSVAHELGPINRSSAHNLSAHNLSPAWPRAIPIRARRVGNYPPGEATQRRKHDYFSEAEFSNASTSLPHARRPAEVRDLPGWREDYLRPPAASLSYIP